MIRNLYMLPLLVGHDASSP